MNQPEEPREKTVASPESAVVPAAAIAAIALYALGMAGAAILLLAGLAVLAVTTGWDAGSYSAAAAAVACGLALGHTFVSRRGGAAPGPGRLLALLTAATGLAALFAAVVMMAARPLHRALWPLLGGSAPGAWLLDVGLAAALFLLPTLCFAAMPGAFSRLLGADRPLVNTGTTLGATFAGLALGAALGGIVLLPVLGVRGSLFVGVALLGLAAGGLLLVRRAGIEAAGSLGLLLAGRGPGEASARPEAGGPAVGTAADGVGPLAGSLAAVMIGLSGWGMMVCWSRVVGLIAGPTGPAGATTLAIFLFGLGLGAFGATALRGRQPAVPLSTALAAAGVVSAATSFFVTRAAVLYLDLVASAPAGGLFSFAGVLIALLFALPAACALGAALTLLPGVLGRDRATPVAFGRVRWSGAILLGAVVGDLLFRLLLVPGAGLRRSLSAASVAALLAAIVVLRSARDATPAARTTGTLTLAGLLIVVGGFSASWEPRLVASASYRYGARGVERLGSVELYLAARRTTTPVFYREGRNATVMVERDRRRPRGGRQPRRSAHPDPAGAPAAPAARGGAQGPAGRLFDRGDGRLAPDPPDRIAPGGGGRAGSVRDRAAVRSLQQPPARRPAALPRRGEPARLAAHRP
jgi:hypothetical protein